MPKPPKNSSLSPQEVLRLLGQDYGPTTWHPRPRYDPISELVFTVLSQHTSDLNAEKAFRNLKETFNSWETVSQASEEAIAQAIKMAGLSRIKAPRIKNVLQEVIRRRGGLALEFLQQMPLEQAKAWLRDLPGVGPKTAAIVLCMALGMPALPVDTHVHRVAKRLGLIDSKTSPDQAHDVLEAKLAPEEVFDFHVYLITHGRRVCKAQHPRCPQCVLAPGCPSSYLGMPKG